VKHPYLLSIILLVTILFSTGCTDPDSIYAVRPSKVDEKCGGVVYNIYSSEYRGDGIHRTCCGNTLYITQSNSYCCGDSYYNASYDASQTCCGGIVYNGHFGCCEDKPYNVTTQHCCKGEIGSGDGHWQVCGGRCYNLDNQRCCDNQLYNFNSQSCCKVHEGDVEYNRSSSWQTEKIHEGKSSCCIGRQSQVDGTFCQPDSGIYGLSDCGGDINNPISCKANALREQRARPYSRY
jgi:hypothetical protein